MPKTNARKQIMVIHGPNLNTLGQREPGTYGHTHLPEINRTLETLGLQLGFDVSTYQSNHEGAIVDIIQKAVGKAAGLIINPAAYTHTSVAIRDALLLLTVPIIEVHISNIHRREPFRHHSYVSDIATGQIVGLGVGGYYLALRAMADLVGAAKPQPVSR